MNGRSMTEAQRLAYHEAVLGLIDRGGPSLREFADRLGLSDRPVQIASVRPSRPRRLNFARAVGGAGGVLALLALTFLGLRFAQAPPFVPSVRVPRVLHMQEAAAIRRMRDAGLNVRTLSFRRSLPSSLYHRVLGVSNAPNERLARGGTVTLYVAEPRRAARASKTHP
jgi:hypothetical protein